MTQLSAANILTLLVIELFHQPLKLNVVREFYFPETSRQL